MKAWLDISHLDINQKPLISCKFFILKEHLFVGFSVFECSLLACLLVACLLVFCLLVDGLCTLELGSLRGGKDAGSRHFVGLAVDRYEFLSIPGADVDRKFLKISHCGLFVSPSFLSLMQLLLLFFF